MKWYKEFKVNMPQNLKSVCNSYTEVFEYEPIWTYKSVEDSKMWVIPPLGKNRIRLDDNGASDKLANIRELVTSITELHLEEETPILAIWRFDGKFPHCPVHVDGGGEHTGSVVTCNCCVKESIACWVSLIGSPNAAVLNLSASPSVNCAPIGLTASLAIINCC